MSDLFDASPSGAPRAGIADESSWRRHWSGAAGLVSVTAELAMRDLAAYLAGGAGTFALAPRAPGEEDPEDEGAEDDLDDDDDLDEDDDLGDLDDDEDDEEEDDLDEEDDDLDDDDFDDDDDDEEDDFDDDLVDLDDEYDVDEDEDRGPGKPDSDID